MEDLRTIIQAAAAAPIIGVGISRGSNLLIQLTHRHPELVGKIVTVGTPMIGTLPNGCPVFNPDYTALRQDAYARGAVEELYISSLANTVCLQRARYRRAATDGLRAHVQVAD